MSICTISIYYIMSHEMLYPHQEDFVLISCFELGIKLECKQKKLCKHKPNVWKGCFPCLWMYILLRTYISKCLSLNCNQVLCQRESDSSRNTFHCPEYHNFMTPPPPTSHFVCLILCIPSLSSLVCVQFIIQQELCVFSM